MTFLKRIKLPGWILIICGLVAIVFGVYQLISNNSQTTTDQDTEQNENINDDKNETETPEDSDSDSDKNITEETSSSSVYPGLNIKTTTKETDIYTISISQPQTNVKHINEKIDAWIKEQENLFQDGISEREEYLEESDFSTHLNIHVDTQRIADKIYTLHLVSNLLTGGANGETNQLSMVIDLNEGKILKFSDVFKTDDDTLDELMSLMKEKLNAKEDIAPFIFDELLEDTLNDPESWKWSVSHKEVVFYFDKYEIAAGAAGLIELHIAMDDMKQYLHEDFAGKIDVTIPKEDPEVEESPKDWPKLDPDGKYVALTFDDGPHPDITPRILKALEEHDALATFFMLGSQVEYYPDMANKVDEAGHAIGTHTINHKDLTALSPEGVKKEIVDSLDMIKKATGRTPSMVRPPYGATNDVVDEISAKHKLAEVMWSVDSLDWKSRNANAIHKEVISHVVPGAIVLMHDIHPETADALPGILDELENEGYEFVTVPQLLDMWEKEGVGPFYGNIR